MLILDGLVLLRRIRLLLLFFVIVVSLLLLLITVSLVVFCMGVFGLRIYIRLVLIVLRLILLVPFL